MLHFSASLDARDCTSALAVETGGSGVGIARGASRENPSQNVPDPRELPIGRPTWGISSKSPSTSGVSSAVRSILGGMKSGVNSRGWSRS